MILEAHVLAGNKLAAVWTPPQRLRDDRELVRARTDVAEELTRTKVKIASMLKRYPLGIDRCGDIPLRDRGTLRGDSSGISIAKR